MPATDATKYRFKEAPATSAFAITPSDDDELPFVTRGLYVGVAGDVKVDMANATPGSPSYQAVTFKAMPVGLYPLRIRKVYSTGTAATDLVGLY